MTQAADRPASEARPPTPQEVQVYLLRTETQRKDKKIRSMVAEMKEMNDMLMKYRWEVKEVAEEENEVPRLSSLTSCPGHIWPYLPQLPWTHLSLSVSWWNVLNAS